MSKRPPEKISKRMVDALSAHGRPGVYWDRDLPGFGVRLYPTGRTTYVVQSRGPTGSRRVTVGQHGAISAEQARKAAAAIIDRIKAGEDPIAEVAEPVREPTVGDHPADRVATEDVEHDVEVEVRPLRRPQQLGDIPGPGLVRRRGHQLGFGVLGMLTLIAPLPDRLIRGQDPIHRPLRAQVVAFVEQRRHDLRWRTVDEAWAGEHIENLLALGFTQRPGGR